MELSRSTTFPVHFGVQKHIFWFSVYSLHLVSFRNQKVILFSLHLPMIKRQLFFLKWTCLLCCHQVVKDTAISGYYSLSSVLCVQKAELSERRLRHWSTSHQHHVQYYLLTGCSNSWMLKRAILFQPLQVVLFFYLEDVDISRIGWLQRKKWHWWRHSLFWPHWWISPTSIMLFVSSPGCLLAVIKIWVWNYKSWWISRAIGAFVTVILRLFERFLQWTDY